MNNGYWFTKWGKHEPAWRAHEPHLASKHHARYRIRQIFGKSKNTGKCKL